MKKALLITRHGKNVARPNEDSDSSSLTDASVQHMYDATRRALGDFVKGAEIDVLADGAAFVSHSPLKRTRYTGMARVAGAFGYQPTPERQEDLDNHRLITAVTSPDPRLYFGHNDGFVLRDEDYYKMGEKAFAEGWVQGNVPKGNTPFQEAVAIKRPILVEGLDRLLRGNAQLGVLSTHSCVAEALMAAAVNSARPLPVSSAYDIGGQVTKEGFGVIEVDGKDARFVRYALGDEGEIAGQTEYPVNLGRLRA